MGLFSRKKTTKEVIASKRVNYAGESMDRLDASGNLPFGWVTHNQNFVNMIEADLQPFRAAIIEAKTDIEKYAALKSFVLFLDDGKKHYYEVNECVGKYFEEYIIDSCEAEQRKKEFAKIESKLKGQK
jgi:hypothetical protein